MLGVGLTWFLRVRLEMQAAKSQVVVQSRDQRPACCYLWVVYFCEGLNEAELLLSLATSHRGRFSVFNTNLLLLYHFLISFFFLQTKTDLDSSVPKVVKGKKLGDAGQSRESGKECVWTVGGRKKKKMNRWQESRWLIWLGMLHPDVEGGVWAIQLCLAVSGPNSSANKQQTHPSCKWGHRCKHINALKERKKNTSLFAIVLTEPTPS